jgi:hypothetical protein
MPSTKLPDRPTKIELHSAIVGAEQALRTWVATGPFLAEKDSSCAARDEQEVKIRAQDLRALLASVKRSIERDSGIDVT